MTEQWLKSLEGKKSIFEHDLDRRDDEERWIETQELFGDTAPPGERISRIEWETIGKQSGYGPTPHSDVSLEIMEEYIKNRQKRKPSPRKKKRKPSPRKKKRKPSPRKKKRKPSPRRLERKNASHRLERKNASHAGLTNSAVLRQVDAV